MPDDMPNTAAEFLQYLRECDELEAMEIAKGWETNPTQFESRWLAHGDPPEDVAALIAECRRLRQGVHGLPSVHLLGWAQEAQLAPSEPVGDQEPDEPPGVAPPKFRTGITRIDHLTAGGGYGMTVIAGRPKCGKSVLALSAAVEAARDGWRVLYFNAELSRTEMANRVLRYCGTRIDPVVIENLSIHPTELGITVPYVLAKMRERVQIQDDKMLLVVDSVNRIADMCQSDSSEHGYWYALKEWREWLRRCAMISEGQLASIVVSELNAGGYIKGRNLEYAADLCISITREEQNDENGGRKIVEIDVPHARSSAGGYVGKFQLDWREGRFEHVGEE